MTPETLTLDQLKAVVAHHAGTDAAFRAELIAAPKAAVARLLSSDLPAHVKIQVVEEAPDTYVVVLPPPASGELSDADLESVAGGASKAENDHNAKKAASLFFGFAPSVAAELVSGIALISGDRSTAVKTASASRDIATCGAR